MTVDDFLDIAQTALSGEGLGGYSLSDFTGAATNINENFNGGNHNGVLTCPYDDNDDDDDDGDDDDEENNEPYIEVSASCANNDVIFTISNTGDKDMEDDYDFTITKNGNEIEDDDYELDINETLEIVVSGYDTDVFVIEVETPRGETLTETITGCGEEEDDDNGGGDDDDETITEDFLGTLAYEDLWPGKGDYDFNDLVIDYEFEITKTNQEIVQDITATFTIKAFGASQHNGFGFTIPSLVPGDIASVDGYDIDGSSVFDIAGNGTEQNQSQATFIVFDDVRRVMPQTTPGVGVNTELQHDFIEPVTIQLSIELSNNAITYGDLDIGSFNPFIVVNSVINDSPGERGREVHLPGYEPSDLFDASYFGQQEDASDPREGTYFVTDNNLPWAINIAEGFDWVIEYRDITDAYTHFADWAQSNGTLYPDWYLDSSGLQKQQPDLPYANQPIKQRSTFPELAEMISATVIFHCSVFLVSHSFLTTFNSFPGKKSLQTITLPLVLLRKPKQNVYVI
ncbi:MAG: LruC domain-containing protein [Bacteroidales bacterium]|nr:LruC domain-containing protein [Bacteroidales bacterium]